MTSVFPKLDTTWDAPADRLLDCLIAQGKRPSFFIMANLMEVQAAADETFRQLDEKSQRSIIIRAAARWQNRIILAGKAATGTLSAPGFPANE